MSRLNEKIRYTLQEEAAVEDFDDGSLVFLCRKRRLIQINMTARRILDLMDGTQTLKDIIKLLPEKYSVEENTARRDVHELVNELGTAGVLKPFVKLGYQERIKMDETSTYLANPEVSLREEDGDGAILFNAESDALLIINPIGLIIWKYIEPHPRSKSEIVAHLKDMCDDVPAEQVEPDVVEFIEDLLAKGFIGEVMDE